MTYYSGTLASTTTPAKDYMDVTAARLTSYGYAWLDTWSSPTTSSWSGVAFGAGVFVAVAQGALSAAVSTDGVTWSAASLNTTVQYNWSAVTYGSAAGFVAVATGAVQAVAVSPDGTSWTVYPTAMPSAQNWASVAYGNGVYAAVTGSGTVVATSTNGSAWTAGTLSLNGSWDSIVYQNSTFVVSGSAQVFTNYSTDGGATWANRAGQIAAYRYAYGANVWCTAHTAGAGNAYTAPAAFTPWTARPMPSTGVISTTFSVGTYFGGGLFMAINASVDPSVVMTSPDGITWTWQRLPSASNSTWRANGAAYGNNRWVVISQNATAMSTDGGATWTVGWLPGVPPASPVAYVFRSPAASNVSGRDWYLILRRASDTATAIFYQVCESYDQAAHAAAGYGGIAQTVRPGAGGINPGPPLAADKCFAANAQLPIASGSAWYLSVTWDRVVMANNNAARGIYCGLYEDLLPSGSTVMPLVAAPMIFSNTSTYGIGSGSVVACGGFTREPGSALNSNLNFEAAIHNATMPGSSSAAIPYALTPVSTTASLYNNQGLMSRVPVGSLRAGSAFGDSVRGLLYGVTQYNSTASQANQDTITVAGKTYIRLAGASVLCGLFVDQA